MSEGEKNIITFCYFLYLVKANKEKKIIVIDDLHSSLDESYLEYVCKNLLEDKLLNNANVNVIQLFLLSHHYYFILELLHNHSKKLFRNQDEVAYFQCALPDTSQNIQICTIPKGLEFFCHDKKYVQMYIDAKSFYDLYQTNIQEAENNYLSKIKIREFVEKIFDHLYPTKPYMSNITDKGKTLLPKNFALLNPHGHNTSKPIASLQTYHILQELFANPMVIEHFQKISK